MRGAGDLHIERAPDARPIEPHDALVRVARAAICGSDLWLYKTLEHMEKLQSASLGHLRPPPSLLAVVLPAIGHE
jgi:threonine dehydrogenase-like Zn-dependent dehydrogenase